MMSDCASAESANKPPTNTHQLNILHHPPNQHLPQRLFPLFNRHLPLNFHPPFNLHPQHLPGSIRCCSWHHPPKQGRLGLITLHPAGWSPVYWGTLPLSTVVCCCLAPCCRVGRSPLLAPLTLSLLSVQPSQGEMKWTEKWSQTSSWVQRNLLQPHCHLNHNREILWFIHLSWNLWRWHQT